MTFSIFLGTCNALIYTLAGKRNELSEISVKIEASSWIVVVENAIERTNYMILETLRLTFLTIYAKRQTSRSHVIIALPSGLPSAVHVLNA